MQENTRNSPPYTFALVPDLCGDIIAIFFSAPAMQSPRTNMRFVVVFQNMHKEQSASRQMRHSGTAVHKVGAKINEILARLEPEMR